MATTQESRGVNGDLWDRTSIDERGTDDLATAIEKGVLYKLPRATSDGGYSSYSRTGERSPFPQPEDSDT